MAKDPRVVRAALVQMSAHQDKSRNVERAAQLIRQAASNGARIVCLQELFNTIYFPFEVDPKYFDLAEPIDGPTIQCLANVAREEEIVVIAPIYEETATRDRYNTAVVLGPDGNTIGFSRKSGIAAVSFADLYGDETYYFKPGDTGYETFETPFARIGILICYDRHFPEAARILALRGAEVVFVPTATSGTSKPFWKLELRAHAITNLYYVGGVNRVGHDERGQLPPFYGSSFFCGPAGEVLSEAGDQREEVLVADLDMSVIETLREQWGFFQHRRPDLYGPLVDRVRT